MFFAIASASATQNTAMWNAIRSSQAASRQIGDHLLATVTKTITDLDQRLTNQTNFLTVKLVSLALSQKDLSASHAVSHDSIASLARKLNALTASLVGPHVNAQPPDVARSFDRSTTSESGSPSVHSGNLILDPQS